jgi:hypothetical protein
MSRDALGAVVIDRDEHCGLARAGPGGDVVAAHRVYRIANDRAVVVTWAVWRAARDGANRSCPRISRSGHRRKVQAPLMRSRAQTLRWPWP